MIRSVLLIACLLPGPLLAQDARATARVMPLSRRAATAEGHQGHETVSQEARLASGAINYGLLYNSCWHASHTPGGADGSAYLGMPQPTSANWYQGGFLRLKINGDDLGQVPLRDWWVAEEGRRAAVKMYFDHPRASVLITSLLYAGDDRLFVIITLSPKTDITALDLSLLSYPSYFTYWNKRNGDRKGLTAIQTYLQADGKKQQLNPAAQWWTAFTDTIFDPAKGEGDGGCAVAFVPEQISAAEIVVGSYACTMDLKVKPETRQIRLCFWDFNKRPNAEALAKLSAALPQTEEQLRTLSPLPLAITDADPQAQATAARTQLAPIAGSQALAQKLTDHTQELLRLRQELLDNKSPDPAAAEKALAEKLAAFEQLLWDVKFFVLIHG
jgi:hypothetical protein